MNATVVGAGVIGLSTALALKERGHQVRIVAGSTLDATTSAVAGAVWFPYRVGPPLRVMEWATQTRTWLAELATGVTRVTAYEITPDEAPSPPQPWWAGNLGLTRAEAPVTGRPLAWHYTSFCIEPAVFLPWLTAQLPAIEHRVIVDLAAEPGDVIVNCAGLDGGRLARPVDDAITPLFGQVVITDVGAVDRTITLTDDRDPDAMFYVIPRRDELVLGGCSLPWQPGAPPIADPAVTERILGQAQALGLPIGNVRAVRPGLRPYRAEVRLERDPVDARIIHNYGHGGAGYTLCRGCALEVASLVV